VTKDPEPEDLQLEELYTEKVETFEKHNPSYKPPEIDSPDINIKTETDKMNLMINKFGLSNIKKPKKSVKYYPK
jgi:hypothetical protein